MQCWTSAIILVLVSCGIESSFAFQFEPSAMWKNIKRALQGPDGKEYFEKYMKDAMLPTLEGTLVSSTPAAHPNEFLVAIADDHTPEVTLKLERPLEKPLPAGTRIRFEGVPYEFTKEPFMLKFNVENEHFRAVEDRGKPEQPAAKKGK